MYFRICKQCYYNMIGYRTGRQENSETSHIASLRCDFQADGRKAYPFPAIIPVLQLFQNKKNEFLLIEISLFSISLGNMYHFCFNNNNKGAYKEICEYINYM